jgi:hypothetical protein
VQELDFLGYRVSDAGVTLPQKKVDSILAHPHPGNLQKFRVSWDGKLLPSVLVAAPDALRGSKTMKEPIAWTADMVEAVTDTKETSAKAALMAHPSPGAEIALMADASGCHVGVALQQHFLAAVALYPPGFYSKKLDSASGSFWHAIQFLDSPEIPSDEFLMQFSQTLSAAEHPSTRHKTAAAWRLLPKLLPYVLARTPAVFVRSD